jgi:hypothetical protein
MSHPSIHLLLKYTPRMTLHFWKWLDPSGYRGPSYPQWIDALHARNHLYSRIVSMPHQERVASLQPPQSLPDIALGTAHDEVTIVAQGAWIEQTRGQQIGRLVYRHRRFADGGWLIEEQYAFEKGDVFSMGGGQRWTRTLDLAPNLTIRHATFLQEAFLGSEHTEIMWLSSGKYRIRRAELDGHETTRTLATPPLLPSEELSATIIPLLLQKNRDATATPCNSPLRVHLTRNRSTGPGRGDWTGFRTIHRGHRS